MGRALDAAPSDELIGNYHDCKDEKNVDKPAGDVKHCESE